jgi:hypothetical protein
MFKVFYLVFSVVMFAACLPSSEGEKADFALDVNKPDTAAENKLVKKKFTGEKKSYYPDGKIETIVRYKDGKREGKAQNFYKNGQVCVEAEFKNGQKEGLYTWYFENGKPYITIEYKQNEQTGWQKGYHYNGAVKYEAKFNKGQPCTGMKTYDAFGKPRKNTELLIKDLGYNINTGLYVLHLELSEKEKDIKYYVISDDRKTQCFDDNAIEDIILPNTKGTGIIEIPLARGEYIMMTVTFGAKYTTKHGIETYLQRTYNLSAESSR